MINTAELHPEHGKTCAAAQASILRARQKPDAFVTVNPLMLVNSAHTVAVRTLPKVDCICERRHVVTRERVAAHCHYNSAFGVWTGSCSFLMFRTRRRSVEQRDIVLTRPSSNDLQVVGYL